MASSPSSLSVVAVAALLLGGTPFPSLISPRLEAAQTQEAQQKQEDLFTVTPERPLAIYRAGDTVSFIIRLKQNGKPVNGESLHWKISKDGVPPISEGTVALKNGEATVTAKLDEPGFLLCEASYQKEGKEIVALGGAGVDPLQIRPSLDAPDDFDAFWEGKKTALAQVPINARLTPVDSPAPEVEVFDLQADCIGAPVSGYLARPKGAKPKTLPAILTLHGAGVGDSWRDVAVAWAKENMLALDINAHGIPNGKPKEFYDALRDGELRDYRGRGRTSKETFYFQGMFLRVIRAIDALAAQPEWDGRTLVLYGSSQGGAQSIAGAGLDPRVTFFVAGVPAMCDMTGTKVGRIAGWPKLAPVGEDGKPDARIIETLRYFDSANFTARTKASAFFTVGFIDKTCPPTTVYAAYNQLASEKRIFNDITAGHTNTDEAKKRMRRAVHDHVAAQNK